MLSQRTPLPLHVLRWTSCRFLFTLCARGRGKRWRMRKLCSSGSESEHVGLGTSASQWAAVNHKPGCRRSADGYNSDWAVAKKKNKNLHVYNNNPFILEDLNFLLKIILILSIIRDSLCLLVISGDVLHQNTSRITGGGTPCSQILLGAYHNKSNRHPYLLGHSLVS